MKAMTAAMVIGAAMIMGSGPAGDAGKEKQVEKPKEGGGEKVSPFVLGFTMKGIEGETRHLEQYLGKVVLIVNVASQCGLTRGNYAGLQKLYDAKKKEGFEILAFPANNFGAQEPGTNEEIKEFCESKFGVTFPMFEKISVKGEDAHPLYKLLAAQPAPIGGEPAWNFTKFLVNRDGNVVARFEPRTPPEDEKLVAKIDELLKQKAGEKPSPDRPRGVPDRLPEGKPDGKK